MNKLSDMAFKIQLRLACEMAEGCRQHVAVGPSRILALLDALEKEESYAAKWEADYYKLMAEMDGCKTILERYRNEREGGWAKRAVAEQKRADAKDQVIEAQAEMIQVMHELLDCRVEEYVAATAEDDFYTGGTPSTRGRLDDARAKVLAVVDRVCAVRDALKAVEAIK